MAAMLGLKSRLRKMSSSRQKKLECGLRHGGKSSLSSQKLDTASCFCMELCSLVLLQEMTHGVRLEADALSIEKSRLDTR